jgi:hypothetical protein
MLVCDSTKNASVASTWPVCKAAPGIKSYSLYRSSGRCIPSYTIEERNVYASATYGWGGETAAGWGYGLHIGRGAHIIIV